MCSAEPQQLQCRLLHYTYSTLKVHTCSVHTGYVFFGTLVVLVFFVVLVCVCYCFTKLCFMFTIVGGVFLFAVVIIAIIVPGKLSHNY